MHNYNKVPYRPHPLPTIRKVEIVSITKGQLQNRMIGDIVGPFIVGCKHGGELCLIKNNLKRYY